MDYVLDFGLQWQEKHLVKAIFVRIINLKEDEIRTYVWIVQGGKNHAKNGLLVFLSYRNKNFVDLTIRKSP